MAPIDENLRRLAREIAADRRAPEGRVAFLIGALGLELDDRVRLLKHSSITLRTLYDFASGSVPNFPWLESGDPLAVPTLRFGVARHPNASAQLLGLVADLDDGRYVGAVVNNPNTTVGLLVRLHQQGRTPCKIAEHPKTPEFVLRELYASGDNQILKSVGSNPRTPPGILAAVALHENRFVRAAVAGNPSLARPLLQRLLADESPRVRKAAARTLFRRR